MRNYVVSVCNMYVRFDVYKICLCSVLTEGIHMNEMNEEPEYLSLLVKTLSFDACKTTSLQLIECNVKKMQNG